MIIPRSQKLWQNGSNKMYKAKYICTTCTEELTVVSTYNYFNQQVKGDCGHTSELVAA
jgi:hypothetical protein